LKGKAGRVFSITPKGEAALKAVKAYVGTFEKELQIQEPSKICLNFQEESDHAPYHIGKKTLANHQSNCVEKSKGDK